MCSNTDRRMDSGFCNVLLGLWVCLLFAPGRWSIQVSEMYYLAGGKDFIDQKVGVSREKCQ
jgi:hypothetical protein